MLKEPSTAHLEIHLSYFTPFYNEVGIYQEDVEISSERPTAFFFFFKLSLAYLARSDSDKGSKFMADNM